MITPIPEDYCIVLESKLLGRTVALVWDDGQSVDDLLTLSVREAHSLRAVKNEPELLEAICLAKLAFPGSFVRTVTRIQPVTQIPCDPEIDEEAADG